jgi:hypothetical protein
MLITSPEFTSNLTGKTNYTKSLDPLDCNSNTTGYTSGSGTAYPSGVTEFTSEFCNFLLDLVFCHCIAV